MDDDSHHRTDPLPCKRPYSAPVLQRLGTVKDLTRTVGNKGSKDGQQTGNQKKTSW